MAPTPPEPAAATSLRSSPAALVWLAVAAGCSAGAGWSVVAGQGELAGALALAAGAGLVVAQFVARPEPSPQVRFTGDLVDRLFDGAILCAVAWRAWSGAPRVAALALVALAVSFFATYVRARGSTLDYPVEESAVNRGIRYALVGLGLVLGGSWLETALWVLVVFMVLTWLVRITQVIKGERLS